MGKGERVCGAAAHLLRFPDEEPSGDDDRGTSMICL